jgi:hypothetical protein
MLIFFRTATKVSKRGENEVEACSLAFPRIVDDLSKIFHALEETHAGKW